MFTIQKVTSAQLDTLLSLSRKTFFDFFAHLNKPADMEAYASVAFTPEQILSELNNPNSGFYFAMLDGEIAGYLKINTGDAQAEFKGENSMEVSRIYVLAEHHGKHIGKKLLDFAVQKAKEQQQEFIWLGVWEDNHKAIGFYEHNGFVKFGSHDFVLGDDVQTDLLMKKEL